VASVRTQQQACPWCSKTSGYRELTSRESMRVISWTLVQGAYLGALHAGGLLLNREDAGRHFGYFRGLLTSGSELCCQACDHIVRVCPRCDAVSKWINSDVETCRICGEVFV
jgi:hypothetical protein